MESKSFLFLAGTTLQGMVFSGPMSNPSESWENHRTRQKCRSLAYMLVS